MKSKILLLGMLVFGILVGYGASQWFKKTSGTSDANMAKTERKIKYWVAPMNPKYRRDKPGKSPMGMDLVPVYETADNDKNSVKISPRIIENLGVITIKARKKTLSREIDTVGYVAANEDNIENIHSYIDGWVRNLKVSAVGDRVQKGQVLFELYSPALVNAQQEFILALSNNNRQLIAASKKKLRTLGLTQNQINTLAVTKRVKQQVAVYSKSRGVVTKLAIRDGMYIKPDNDLMIIEDLSSIWVRVEVNEKQASWVKLGQTALATFTGLPGKQWQGQVIYVYPTLDKTTHTLAVRLKFPNPDLTLKPNMYAAVKIFVPPFKSSIVIPRQAVITTGRGSHVIIALGQGQFKPQRVTLGADSQGMVVIEKGLKLGDKVVVSGQFLIDSESNVNAAFGRLDPQIKQQAQPSRKQDGQTYVATILAINAEKRRVTISHQPIESLGMPEMVMELPLANTVDITKFKVKQRVQVSLTKLSPHHYQIIKLLPLDSKKEPL